LPESLAALEQQRSNLMAGFARLNDLRPGSVTGIVRRCGKPTCHCAQPEDPGHGPTLRLTCKVQGKTGVALMLDISPQNMLPHGESGSRRPRDRRSCDGGRKAQGLEDEPAEPGQCGNRHSEGADRIGDEGVGTDHPVHAAITYVRNHSVDADRMNYARAPRLGLALGSGNVEATCKSLSETRMKRCGERWKEETGQHIVQLRSLALSDRWEPAIEVILRPLRKAVRAA
jgi:hypothetical protein